MDETLAEGGVEVRGESPAKDRARTWNSLRSNHLRSALTSPCCYVLSECEPASNLVVNIQPGANHHGPEDLQLMLDQVGRPSVPPYFKPGRAPPKYPSFLCEQSFCSFGSLHAGSPQACLFIHRAGPGRPSASTQETETAERRSQAPLDPSTQQ